MSEGLVTIAVAGDAAEADLILRTLAEVGISGRLEGAGGRARRDRRTTGRAACSSNRSSWARPRRRCSTRTTTATTITENEGTPPAIFDRMAERYDELRGVARSSSPSSSSSRSREGLGAATRLLDVGCGTGALVATAVERLGVKAWGVDASEPMLAKARERRVRGAAFKLAQADDLPFRKGWFDAVTMRLVVHTLGERRPRALAEARRVLAPEGRLFIWTFAPDHFTGHHLRTYLPVRRPRALPTAEPLTTSSAGGLRRRAPAVVRAGRLGHPRARRRAAARAAPLDDPPPAARAGRRRGGAAGARGRRRRPAARDVLRWQLLRRARSSPNQP